MKFREATEADVLYVMNRSTSQCEKTQPQTIDYVYALEHNGAVLAVGGLKMLNTKSAWAWMNWTPEAVRRQTVVFRVAKEWLDKLIETLELVRVQAAVDPDFEEGVRTIEHLGFKRESRMERFYGDKDADLYVRITE